MKNGTVFPFTQEGGNVMKNYFTKLSFNRWILVLTVAGFIALPLAGGGGLNERSTSPAAIEDETNRTLANGTEIEDPDVDWTLAKNEDKEDETDWTLARNNRIHEEDVDWTLAYEMEWRAGGFR